MRNNPNILFLFPDQQRSDSLGCMGSIVGDKMAELGIGKKFLKIGIQDEYRYGDSKLYRMKRYKIDAMSLVEKVEEVVGEPLNIT